jgi:predicted MFS family arabinose efflux permease
VNRRRWAVLAAYTWVLGVSQMLWLNFAPLISLVEQRYGVSELVASLLVLVFPLLYIGLSLPSGALLDRRGYRYTVGLGAVGMAVFSCVRIFDQSFAFLLAGQIGIALAQPFVVNGISKLVGDWFTADESVLATGLGTMGMFLGMALGMAATPALVDALGLRHTMEVFAAFTAASAVVFGLVVHPNPKARAPQATIERSVFGPLLRNRDQRIFYGLAFLGIGVFNGLTTWLEQILAPRGIDATRAGLVGAALIVGGIIGSVVIPAGADVLKRRKPFLLLCAAAALATIYPLCAVGGYHFALVLGAVHGFFFMPAVALLLDMCAQSSGEQSAGAATSLLMLAGNAGGVAVVVAIPLVKRQTYAPAVALMMALLALTLLLATRAPERRRA